MTAPAPVTDHGGWYSRCCRCPRVQRLFIRVGADLYCGPCWRAAGCPSPAPPTVAELGAAVARIQGGMRGRS